MGKKPIVSVTYENETISIKKLYKYSVSFLFFFCTSFPPLPFKQFLLQHSPSIQYRNSYHKFSNISKPEEDWYGQPNILNVVVKKHTRYYDLLCSHH